VKGVKDPADYIHANATKIILSIYPVQIAARARYLHQTERRRASYLEILMDRAGFTIWYF